MDVCIFRAYFHSKPLYALPEISQEWTKLSQPCFPTSPPWDAFLIPSVFTPGFSNDLFFSFIMYAVLPASCPFICLIALHTFQDTEVARVTIHISKVTKEVIHLNNTPKLVLNIPKHISTWQIIIILLDSLWVRTYPVKIIQNRL